MAKLPQTLTAEQTARAEQAFLARVPKNTPRRLAELAPQILAEIAPELVETADDEDARLVWQRRRAVAKRGLSRGDDGDGSMWFKGSLPHLEAAPLIATLEAYVESDRRAARDRLKATRATGPTPQVVRDQASADINRTPEQRRADALVQLIAEHRGAPSSVGDRPRMVVTIREQDLRERAEAAGVLAKGQRITAGDLRRLCCDADLMPVVLGGASEILDVGRMQRLVTPAIRRALSLRDGGCVFPNCTAPDSACEAHHLRPWWAGGATALHNLVLLCAHHHKLVEPDRYNRPGDRWVIHLDPHTGAAVVTPPGRTQRFTDRTGNHGEDSAQRSGSSPPTPESGPAPPGHQRTSPEEQQFDTHPPLIQSSV